MYLATATNDGSKTTVRHIWTRTGVSLATRDRVKGLERIDHRLDVPYLAMGYLEGSLLDSVFRDSESPLPHPQLAAFARFLPLLSKREEARNLLNTAPSKLVQHSIRRLFHIFEDLIEARHRGSARSVMYLAITYIFRHSAVLLSDGIPVGNSGYRTRFQWVKSQKKSTEIERQIDNEVQDMEALHALPFSSLAERKSAANRAILDKKQVLLDLFETQLTQYRIVCSELERLERMGLQGLSSRSRASIERGGCPERLYFKSLPSQLKLQVAIYLAKRDQLHKFRPTQARNRVTLAGIEILESLASGKGYWSHFEILLARTYLPRRVAFACLCILMVETGLNTYTLQAIKLSDVRRTSQGYTITGIKGKTDQIQTRNIFSSVPEDDEAYAVTSKLAITALELLMASASNFAKFTKEKNDTLLNVLLQSAKRHPKSVSLNTQLIHKALAKLNAGWRFEVSKLRNLAAMAEYTSPTGDIFSTAAFLGHDNALVTAGYIDNAITRALHQSNINRFMKQLAGSILWVVNRDDLVERHNLQSYITKSLLFPLTNSPANDSNSIVDRWIESCGKCRIEFGLDDIHHLALQHIFYKTSTAELVVSNARAFLRYHLPRLIICTALRQIVMDSAHRSLYQAFENAAYAK